MNSPQLKRLAESILPRREGEPGHAELRKGAWWVLALAGLTLLNLLLALVGVDIAFLSGFYAPLLASSTVMFILLSLTGVALFSWLFLFMRAGHAEALFVACALYAFDFVLVLAFPPAAISLRSMTTVIILHVLLALFFFAAGWKVLAARRAAARGETAPAPEPVPGDEQLPPGAKPARKKGRIRENVEVLLSAILIAVVIRVFLIDNYEIPTGSMIPSLLEGDRLFVTKFLYGVRLPVLPNWKLPAFTSPKRGDVVIFQYPLYRSPGVLRELADLFTFSILGLDPQPKNFVKRVIGLPGDRVRLNEEGELFLNGKKVARTFHQRREVRVFRDGGNPNKRRLEIWVNGKKIHEYAKSSMDMEYSLGQVQPGDDKRPLAVEKYVLYMEDANGAKRVVQYVDTPREYLGSAAHLLRPYPMVPERASFYEDLADKYIAKNMLQMDGYELTVPAIPERELATVKGKDISLLVYHPDGEVSYRLKGRKEFRKLFVREQGQLWAVVPPDHFFVMGDNRDMSADSRVWGFVHKGFVSGSPLVRYWPFSRFGGVD